MQNKGLYVLLGLSVGLLIVVNLPLWSAIFGVDPTGFKQALQLLFGRHGANTLLLVVLTLLFSAILAAPAAYLVSAFEFKGKAALSVLLPLSLAVPAYVNAFVYDGVFGAYGTWMSWTGDYYNLRSVVPLALILAAVLYPYLYMALTVSMSHNMRKMGAVASLTGASAWQKFWHLGVRGSVPAFAAGSFLIAMEVINNYGAVAYFGIDTLTTALVNEWNPTDMAMVRNLSVLILLLIYLGFALRGISGKKTEYDWRTGQGLAVAQKSKLALIITVIPVVLGLFIPVAQLAAWALKAGDTGRFINWGQMLGTTFGLAFCAAFLICAILVMVHFTQTLKPQQWLKRLIGVTGLGYAVPGAVIGITVLSFGSLFGGFSAVVAGGSMTLLVFGYIIRFFATGDANLTTALSQFDPNQIHVARMLGGSNMDLFKGIYWPFINKGLLAAFMLVFIDVSKELPLTMLFQTFNFETLAVRSFKLMETDGAAYTAALPSLAIIGIGLLPVTILNRLIKS